MDIVWLVAAAAFFAGSDRLIAFLHSLETEE
jgi:hypothetical protein